MDREHIYLPKNYVIHIVFKEINISYLIKNKRKKARIVFQNGYLQFTGVAILCVYAVSRVQ